MSVKSQRFISISIKQVVYKNKSFYCQLHRGVCIQGGWDSIRIYFLIALFLSHSPSNLRRHLGTSLSLPLPFVHVSTPALPYVSHPTLIFTQLFSKIINISYMFFYLISSSNLICCKTISFFSTVLVMKSNNF